MRTIFVFGVIEEWWIKESLDQPISFISNELSSTGCGIKRPTKDPETLPRGKGSGRNDWSLRNPKCNKNFLCIIFINSLLPNFAERKAVKLRLKKK